MPNLNTTISECKMQKDQKKSREKWMDIVKEFVFVIVNEKIWKKIVLVCIYRGNVGCLFTPP